jgi:hypothetical protein
MEFPMGLVQAQAPFSGEKKREHGGYINDPFPQGSLLPFSFLIYSYTKLHVTSFLSSDGLDFEGFG